MKDLRWAKKTISELRNNKELDRTETNLNIEVGKLQRWAWNNCIDRVLEILSQLDEPEVLSQEWISENVEYAYFDMLDGSGRLSSATAIIKPKKLRNLLVPKQEEVKIDKEDAKNIEQYKSMGWRLTHLVNDTGASASHDELLARAWLDGYTVQEEQKYQVIIRDGEYMRLYLCKHHDVVTIGTNDDYIEKCPEVTYLTEQEIKGYDERYWPFAVKVEEVE